MTAAKTSNAGSASQPASFPSLTPSLRRSTSSHHHTSHKRKFDELLKAARKEREFELARIRNRVNLLTAEKAERAFELNKADEEAQQPALDRLAAIDSEIEHHQRLLRSVRELSAAVDTTAELGDMQARRAMLTCDHQSDNTVHSDTHHNRAASSESESLVERSSSELGDPTGLPHEVLKDCPGCQFAQWKRACVSRLRHMEQHASGLQMKRKEEVAAQLERIKHLEESRRALETLDTEIEQLKGDIIEAEADISSVAALCKD